MEQNALANLILIEELQMQIYAFMYTHVHLHTLTCMYIDIQT